MLTYCAAPRAGYSLIRVSLQSIAYFQKFVKTALHFFRELLNVVFVAKHIQRMYAVCFRGMCKLRPVICLQNVRSVTEEFNCSFEKIHCGEAALLFIRVDKSIPRRFFYDRYIDRISARLFRNNKHLARISHPFATFRRGLSVHRIRRYAWIFSLWIPVSS